MGSVRYLFLENLVKFRWKHARVTFLIKLQVSVCNFIKEALAQVFSCEFCEIFKNTFFYKTLVAASAGCKGW